MAYTKPQIEQLWISEGGDPRAASTAAAVALAESGGRPGAVNSKNSDGSIDRGLFQINSVHGAQSTTDLKANVRAAIRISGNGKNWHPWVTYTTGAYRKFTGAGSGHSTPSSSSVPGSSSPQIQGTRTIPGQSFAGERQAATASFLSQRGSSASQNLSFAQQFSQIPQDVASRTIPGQANTGGSGTPQGAPSGLAQFAQHRAEAIDAQHLPYQWGGGHGGQTPLGKAVPLDCSGAVSKVLGIDPRVSGAFQSWGRPGDGGNTGVTVYANSHHVIMKIDGHYWGTSGSNPGGGAGWIKADQISPQYLKGFTARHSNR